MLKVSIKNKLSQQITNQAQFETQEEIDSWVIECEAVNAFGKPEHQVVVTEAVYDEETGEILEEAVYETVPAEYTIEVEDIAAQVQKERINREAQAYLDSTDFYIIRELDEGTPCPEEIKQERYNCRRRIVR